MPISDAGRGAAAIAAALCLAGCLDGAGFAPAAAPARMAVAGGAVTVAGPPGYCIDRRLVRESRDESFVVLGACAALPGGGAAPSGIPAVLTATVAAAPLAAPTDPALLERLLRSEAGRAAMSRGGAAETVEVFESRVEGGAVLLRMRDVAAAAEGPRTDPTYWRAVLDLGGHPVTATVMAFADRPLSADAGFRLIGAFVARLRAENADRVGSGS